MFRTVLAIAIGASLSSSIWPADVLPLAQAEELHKRTEYSASLALLNTRSADGATNFLIGRNYFMLGDFKQSTEFLQRAVNECPANAEYVDWLGRSYGRRAETSNPLFAPGFASKARQAFEKSVELDPKNADALSDLFDYYLEAPGFLGGGYDKASEVARKIAAVDPPEGFFEEAKLAQKRKEFQSAEVHIRQAIAVTPKKVGALLVYAKFLSNQGRTRECDAILAEAQQIQPDAPQVWYARADLFIKQGRNFPEARDLLERYMHATITVDDPPKDDAARLLKQVGGA